MKSIKNLLIIMLTLIASLAIGCKKDLEKIKVLLPSGAPLIAVGDLLDNEAFEFTVANGADLLKYINAFFNTPVTIEKEYSDACTLLYDAEIKEYEDVASFMKNNFEEVLTNEESLEVINAFFINDLNSSKTAGALYMHRNTLNKKLDAISRQLGLNIQNFKHASAILLLLNYRR